MNFIAAGLSDVGLQREHNEDSYCILSEHRLFVVADGMGGHRAGDVASHMATKEITAFFDATSVDDDGAEAREPADLPSIRWQPLGSRNGHDGRWRFVQPG